MLDATQVRGDFVKAVGKRFPHKNANWPNGTLTVRIEDDHKFNRQIIIPAIHHNGSMRSYEHNDLWDTCRLIVKKNGSVLYDRTATSGCMYSGVIDMPAGQGR